MAINGTNPRSKVKVIFPSWPLLPRGPEGEVEGARVVVAATLAGVSRHHWHRVGIAVAHIGWQSGMQKPSRCTDIEVGIVEWKVKFMPMFCVKKAMPFLLVWQSLHNVEVGIGVPVDHHPLVGGQLPSLRDLRWLWDVPTMLPHLPSRRLSGGQPVSIHPQDYVSYSESITLQHIQYKLSLTFFFNHLYSYIHDIQYIIDCLLDLASTSQSSCAR